MEEREIRKHIHNVKRSMLALGYVIENDAGDFLVMSGGLVLDFAGYIKEYDDDYHERLQNFNLNGGKHAGLCNL